MHTPRGKVLGGSSSINGLVYIRGNPQDFERWEQEGAAAGPTATCCRISSAPRRARRAAIEYRGGAGKLQTSYGTLDNPLHARLARRRRAGRLSAHAGRQRLPAGRLRPHGHDGRARAGAAAPRAPILRPAMRRPNLKVLTHALATRVCSRAGAPAASDTARAATSHRRARRREVILCGGPDQLAAAAEALRRRARPRSCGARHRGRARFARRRREPAGSSGVLFPGRLQGADHAVLVDQPAGAGR